MPPYDVIAYTSMHQSISEWLNQGRRQEKLRGGLMVVSGTRPPLKNENSSDLGLFKLKMSKMRRKK